MFKRLQVKLRRNIVFIMMIFIVGNTLGNNFAYVSIDRDCSILGTFRIGEVAYSCKKHTP
jgi:uncharacterized membrane protein YwaF